LGQAVFSEGSEPSYEPGNGTLDYLAIEHLTVPYLFVDEAYAALE
jgi:hypothetical protein